MPERSKVKHVAVLTTGRQDYGILRSTIRQLAAAEDFRLSVWAGGMHLHERFGRTVEAIREDGVAVAREIPFLDDEPEPLGDAARAVVAVGSAIAADRPDALLLVGDRTETLAAGFAATIQRTPIIHVHGGEETEGAIDNACRHALTKLSQLHLVSHSLHARRVVQMGERPDSVVVVGPPGVDNLYRHDLPSRAELATFFGHQLRDPIVLVTLHPATLGDDPLTEVSSLAAALENISGTIIITQPNADQGSNVIRDYWSNWAASRSDVILVDVLGPLRYWALLRVCAVMAGNSSSGIIEAPAARVPVVNVGDRQKGRLRVGAIVDVPAQAGAIEAALRTVLGGAIAAPISPLEPYPLGPAAPRIVAALRRWATRDVVTKPFLDLDLSMEARGGVA